MFSKCKKPIAILELTTDSDADGRGKEGNNKQYFAFLIK